MPQVVIVDEIGTEAEALACRTIAERGVTLIATAHGLFLENLIKNPTLSGTVTGGAVLRMGHAATQLGPGAASAWILDWCHQHRTAAKLPDLSCPG
jgi:stage III sporulation protein SpoIIIAA